MINLRKQNASAAAVPTGEQMKWICMDCNRAKRPATFHLPKGVYPKAACPMCGSHQILDINVQPITLVVVGRG